MSSGAGTISLPSGGGALQGIGEKFSADLHTGTGNFTVPIALPPGRNGFQPDLSLAYSTGNGNGPFGLGWNLGVPGISRKTSRGVPRYDDTEDTFILSGAEDLVPVERTPGRTRYRPRTEGLFARIDHHHDGTNDYWQVRSKDGLVSFYGIPGRAGRDPTVVADPMDGGRVFAWNLARTVDPHGNRIDYEYERDQGEDAFHRWDQLCPERIRYADYAGAEATGYLISVTFEYENRPDPFSDRRAGFEVRTTKRCRFIRVTTHADEDRPVRAYRLTYLDQLPAAQDLPPNGVSLLASITVVGADGDLREELPPLEFGYTRFEPQKREFSTVGGKNARAVSLAQPGYELVDLSGNGLPDVLEMNGTVRYWRNLGDGIYDTPREMRGAPAGLSLTDAGVQLVDADGDGRTDLLVTQDGLAGYYPTRFGGAWDRRSFQRYAKAPGFDLEDPEVRLVDLDGDGVTDAIRSGTSLECFFNGNGDGWNETRRVERRAIGSFPNVSFSDPRLRWADVTGDGLEDIVLVHDGNIEYWPSLGRGNWGRRVSMRTSPRFPEGYDPRRVLLGDVDGDGLADIVYVDDDKVTLWINQCGNAWSRAFEIRGTPSVADTDTVRLSDMFGTGIAGVLWSAEVSPDSSGGGMRFLDFTGGTKPYLLSETDNNTGAVTKIGYLPSTRFYLDDEGRPETRWKTPLPFPVQVVARVEAIDAISGGKLTTEYAYHHGYWDGAEREFRGFGRVDQRDTETFEDFGTEGLHPRRSFAPVGRSTFSPPTETRTWFHQGPVGDEFGGWEEPDHTVEFWRGDPQVLSRPQEMENFLKGLPRRARRDALRTLRGRVLRTELYALDGTTAEGRPYTVTEHLHGLREEASPGEGENRSRIFFPHALAERTTQWERGSDPMVKFDFTSQYDAYGQPGSALSLAVPRGRDPRETVTSGSSEPYLATQTLTDYARRDDEVFIADRVARVTTYEIPNYGVQSLFSLARSVQEGTAEKRIVGQTINFYDGPAFTGLAFGKIGTRGALVRTETLAATDRELREAYPAGDPLLTVAAEPPYWATSGAPAWPSEYPQAFSALLPTDQHADPTRPGLAITPLQYGFNAGEAGSPYVRGYFAATERHSYDFHGDPEGRGLLEATRDPVGIVSKVEFDTYGLLPVAATDAAGLSTRAAHDYRVLKPAGVTDPDGNTTLYSYTPLGLLKAVVVTGKEGEGDTPEAPGSRYEYDFAAFEREKQPISVRTVRRFHHANDADVPQPERDEVTETVEYSDGFGRLLQARTRAEDVIFGDPDFGGGVLPADQSTPAGDAGDVIGRPTAGGPRVVVSGWQAYNNKGRVVEKHEPFFSEGWDYGWGERERAKLRMFYDPRGQVIRTLNPDGTEQRVLHGVPEDLSDPTVYKPTPWEAYTYDANDNAGRTHPETTAAYGHHRNTPNSATVDALGRTVETVKRDGPGADNRHVTMSSYDIRDNLLSMKDALGRVAFRNVYDLANRVLRSAQLDAGSRRTVFDPAGGVVEERNGRGALILSSFDGLRRPSRVWARDEREGRVTLRELLVYGDGGIPDQPTAAREAARAANRLGRLYQHHDEAGRLTLEGYDFKGNVLERVRQTISDAAILSVFSPPPPDWRVVAYRVDWQPPPGTTLDAHAGKLLDKTSYATSLAYDAVNRMRILRYPRTVDGTRKTLLPRYDLGGGLRSVGLDGQTFIEHIAYDAKGQRTLVAYGNGLMTRHAYDENTFRLARTRTERYTKPAGDGPAYRPSGAPLQDLLYQYDLSGNVLGIVDRTPGCGVQANPEALQETDPVLAQRLAAGDALVRRFEYDPLYRLTSATGRECKDVPKPRPWTDAPYCGHGSGSHGLPNQGNAPNLTAAYRETYAYDPAGNMTSLRHQVGGDAWTRLFGIGGLTPEQWDAAWRAHLDRREWLDPPGNRLTHVGAGNAAQTHSYDACGNLVGEGAGRHFEWDHEGRMRAYRTQSGTAEPSVHAHYLYDAGGTRVKKLVRKGASVEVTTYIDGAFEHHRLVKTGSTTENNTLHVMDDGSRVATVRVGTPFADDNAPAVRYHLGDHLGSSVLVVDAGGGWINREEYTPYGETIFGGFARKRYRFTGKERDEESGLYYHGARYYAPWLSRWASCDPAGTVDGANLYRYAQNNPINLVDPSGKESEPPSQTSSTGPYKAVRGDHVHQVASRTERPGAPRESAPQFNEALSVSTKDPSYKDVSGQKVESAINRAQWGKDYKGRPAGPTGTVELVSTGETRVGSTEPAQPSQWFEDTKSFFKLREAGKSSDEALRLVNKSAKQLEETGATPQRVPNAPRSAPQSIKVGQTLSRGFSGKPPGNAGFLDIGPLAKTVTSNAGKAVGAFLIGAITNAIATSLALPPELGPVPDKDIETMSTLLGALPPGADIAAAGTARVMTETAAMPVFKEFYQPGFFNNFIMSGFR